VLNLQDEVRSGFVFSPTHKYIDGGGGRGIEFGLISYQSAALIL